MNLVIYEQKNKSVALGVQADMEKKGKSCILQPVTEENLPEVMKLVQAITKSEVHFLYIVQNEDHSFFYDSDLLKEVYYCWTDSMRLRWVLPSHFSQGVLW